MLHFIVYIPNSLWAHNLVDLSLFIEKMLMFARGYHYFDVKCLMLWEIQTVLTLVVMAFVASILLLILSSVVVMLVFRILHLTVETDMPARFGWLIFQTGLKIITVLNPHYQSCFGIWKHNIWLKEIVDCASPHSFMLTVICPIYTSVQCLGPGGHPDWDRRAKSIWTIKL